MINIIWAFKSGLHDINKKHKKLRGLKKDIDENGAMGATKRNMILGSKLLREIDQANGRSTRAYDERWTKR